MHGPDLSDRHHTKTVLIEAACAGVREPESFMIGDREDDVHAAHEAGIGAIGVTWGYGTRPELERAGAEILVDSPAALPHVVRSAAIR